MSRRCIKVEFVLMLLVCSASVIWWAYWWCAFSQTIELNDCNEPVHCMWFDEVWIIVSEQVCLNRWLKYWTVILTTCVEKCNKIEIRFIFCYACPILCSALVVNLWHFNHIIIIIIIPKYVSDIPKNRDGQYLRYVHQI